MTMLTPTEAARLILEHIAPLPAVRRSLREALDLVLAEDVASPIDLPPGTIRPWTATPLAAVT